jgi:putative molybdopterin biosynthesis protein
MSTESVYLHDIPLEEAFARLEKALQEHGRWELLEREEIPLNEQALGRVLAEPVWARLSSPHYHAAAMDGFAIRAEETAHAQPTAPVILQRFQYVDTGDALPDWANAVVPIENVEALDESGQIAANPRRPAALRLRAALVPWSHVRPMGEDIVATELVLPAGHVLRPVDLGAIAAAGHTSLIVSRRPRVAILPTGTELVPIGTAVRPGDILEYNSLVLAAQVLSMGGLPTRFPITPDDFDLICERVEQARQEHDLILLNAGSSAGSEDFSARVVQKLGQLLVHGVAVRPGHPVILGLLPPKEGRPAIPIIGVPGYPVSAALTIEIFVEPLMARWLGRSRQELPVIEATLTRKLTSPPGDDDYVRVVVGRVGQRVLAAPLSRGAGVITSLVRADGLVILRRGVQGVEAGETVKVHLYRSLAEIERTIFAIGSHDMTLDLMAQFLARHQRRLVSANVGSLGGLLALKRKEAHLSGSHLLDPQSGEYNLPYIRKYLAGQPVRVIGFLKRQQGLLVQRGNPKNIRDLEDLTRPGITFVNRQRGAGTRILLDYHLEQKGIPTEAIAGYDQEEYTHLGVAAAVASGRADCGLGIAAAAQALDLDFIPLFEERYDLIIPQEHFETPLLAPLLELLQTPAFREAVSGLPGYDVSLMGILLAEV